MELAISIAVELPCGCILSTAVRNRYQSKVTSGNVRAVCDSAGTQLASWYESKAKAHKCELVTPDNPNGQTP